MKIKGLLFLFFIFLLTGCVSSGDNGNHTHNYIEENINPTCTEEGYTIFRCDSCNYSYQDKFVATLGHEEEIEKGYEATCTNTGLTGASYCRVCGIVLAEPKEIPMIEHNKVIMEAVPPTCTSFGLTEGLYCSMCNEVFVAQEQTPSLGHSFSSEWLNDEYTHYHECDVCHKKDDINSHIPNIPYPTEEEHQECIECGYVMAERLEHIHEMHYFEEKEPNCIDSGNIEHYFCERCGKYYRDLEGNEEISDLTSIHIMAIGHSEVIDNKVEATCLTSGLTAGSHCDRCGEPIIVQQVIPALGHKWNDGVVSINPTCEEAGVLTYTCNACDETKTEDIPALGHAETLTEAVNATCLTSGLSTGVHCSVCNKVITEQTIIPALGHNEVRDKAVAATCLTSGLTEGIHCGRCSEIIRNQQIVPALGHDVVYDAGYAATCTTSGLTEGSYCKVCNEVFMVQQKIPALGHEEFVCEAEDPTCEDIGWKLYSYCANCYEEIIPFEQIDPLGHMYVNEICVRCGEHDYTPGLKFTLNSDGESYSVSSGTAKNAKEIKIPNMYKGKPVTTIGEMAFSSTSATTIIVPESVTSIGRWAFQNNKSLVSLTLPFIGNTKDGTKYTHFGYIFGTDSASGNDQYMPLSLKEVIITGDSPIDSFAFKYCHTIERIIILGNITTIKKYTFEQCFDLVEVQLPESVTIIEEHAFSNCESLKNIILPSKLTSICEYAFSNCSSLESLVIPNTVTNLERNAFSGCRSLTSVNIPNKITVLYNGVFVNCTSLKEIIIPENITSISSQVFWNCSSLESVVIPDTVTHIGHRAFMDCSSLESITLPFVGTEATGTEYSWFGYIFGATSYGNNGEFVPSSLKEVIITQNHRINDLAFEGCSSLKRIYLPKDISSFGSSSFKGCSSLDVYYNGTMVDWCNIEFKNRQCNPMYYANNCYMLDNYGKYYQVSELILPDEVTKIGVVQFAGFNVTNIVIPNTVTYIGSSAFAECNMLESITLPFVGQELDGEYNSGTTRFAYIFDRVPESLKTVTITNAKIIYGYSFEGCKIEEITIVNTDVIIDCYAFICCDYLKKMTLPFVGRTIDAEESGSLGYMFGSHEGVPESLKEVVITDQTVIYDGAFQFVRSVETIVIPDNVTSIGEYAFYECISLKNINIPNTVTSIGNNAFSICTSLESIVLPEKLTVINHGLFFNCFSLKTVNIPSSVETISTSAFYGCHSLKSIVIPIAITSIGSQAFEDCPALENVYYKGTEEMWSLISIGRYNTGFADAKFTFNYLV